MCLGIPMKIVERQTPYRAIAESLGIRQAVRTDLVPGLEPGDYVLVHAGFAVEIIEFWEAEERISLLEEILAKKE